MQIWWDACVKNVFLTINGNTDMIDVRFKMYILYNKSEYRIWYDTGVKNVFLTLNGNLNTIGINLGFSHVTCLMTCTVYKSPYIN